MRSKIVREILSKNQRNIVGGGGLSLGTVVDGDESDSLTSGLVFYEYHFDENFGLYTKAFFGSSNDSGRGGGGVDIRGLQLSLKARADFLENMSAYARFGASFNDTKSSGITFNNSSSGVGLVGATGLEYLSDDGVIFGLELEYYDAGAVEVIGGNLFVGVRF